YHGLASTCSKKVRLCLYEKGLSFESRLLDLQKFEQHAPDYLALNPNGVVPTLVHDGRPVIESSIIIEYLDDAFPEVPLRPKDPHGRARMRLWTKYSDDVAYKAVYAPTWQALRKRAEEGLSAEARAATLARVPTAERRDRWAKMAETGYSERELEEAYDKMRACLDHAETALAARGPWLAGADYSLADIAIIPFIDRIRNLRPEFMTREAYPALNDWYDRMATRPAFDRAFRFRDDPRAAELPNF
ncbi:MAG: glutathione S-transferase family protein, partial [Candidatus Eiseniibacteriota bacterium]